MTLAAGALGQAGESRATRQDEHFQAGRRHDAPHIHRGTAAEDSYYQILQRCECACSEECDRTPRSFSFAPTPVNSRSLLYQVVCVTAPGISLKTQELYALVFLCRYLDLFTRFVSLCAPSKVAWAAFYVNYTAPQSAAALDGIPRQEQLSTVLTALAGVHFYASPCFYQYVLPSYVLSLNRMGRQGNASAMCC